MKKYECTICGYIYDEAKGDPEHGVPAGTPWINCRQTGYALFAV